jgi:hypothetical protein
MKKNLFFLKAFFCLCVGGAFISAAFSETQLRILYDPRISSKKPNANSSDLAQVRKAFASNLKNFGKSFQARWKYCDGSPEGELAGVFTGSFTRQKVKQSGYALVACERIMIIALLENQKIISITAFAPRVNLNLCIFNEAYAVRDVNRNEFSELAMIMSCGDGPGFQTSLTLYEFNKSTYIPICDDTVRYGFGADGISEYWEKIVYVNPQPKPLFVAQKLLLKDPKDWDSRPLVLSDQMTTFCDEKPSQDSFEISIVRF